MKTLLAGVAALSFLAGVALAGQPLPLNDSQMDKVTAGFAFNESDYSNVSVTGVSVYAPSLSFCRTCYLNVVSTDLFNVHGHPIQVMSQFGPLP